jgi:hypothetical protein
MLHNTTTHNRIRFPGTVTVQPVYTYYVLRIIGITVYTFRSRILPGLIAQQIQLSFRIPFTQSDYRIGTIIHRFTYDSKLPPIPPAF